MTRRSQVRPLPPIHPVTRRRVGHLQATWPNYLIQGQLHMVGSIVNSEDSGFSTLPQTPAPAYSRAPSYVSRTPSYSRGAYVPSSFSYPHARRNSDPANFIAPNTIMSSRSRRESLLSDDDVERGRDRVMVEQHPAFREEAARTAQEQALINEDFLNKQAIAQQQQKSQLLLLQAARKRYISGLKKAIKGVSSPMFAQQIQRQPINIGLGISNIGNAIASNGVDLRHKAAQDMIFNQQFLHPDTDPMAYERSIHAPKVFYHAPQHGF